MTYDLIIIGAGAAGLMAAAEAGRLGLRILVLEGQREPGRKLLICGGGRCNVTNARVSEKDFNTGCTHTVKHVLKGWTPQNTIAFFEQWGAAVTEREGGQFFSADDSAKTVLKALLKAVKAGGAECRYDARVMSFARQGQVFNVVAGKDVFQASALLIATGGLSYAGTGCDGAGYRFAENLGHRLIPMRPALTPLISSQPLFDVLAGIVVPVRLVLWAHGSKVYKTEGPLLFTHKGFSGPAVLEMARSWQDTRSQSPELRVDFFPAWKEGSVAPLLASAGLRTLRSILKEYLPERLADLLLKKAQLDGASHPGRGELNKEGRHALEKCLRSLPLPVQNADGFSKAEVTAGGVDLNSVKGASLESRLQEGVYFAGEVLDVDGRIGGFNLQWAWASGIAVARAVARAKAGVSQPH